MRFFSAADYAFITSYARKLNILDGIRFGSNFKIIHRRAGEFASAWGFGLDVGAQMDYKKWRHAGVNLFFLGCSIVINLIFGIATVALCAWLATAEFGLAE